MTAKKSEDMTPAAALQLAHQKIAELEHAVDYRKRDAEREMERRMEAQKERDRAVDALNLERNRLGALSQEVERAGQRERRAELELARAFGYIAALKGEPFDKQVERGPDHFELSRDAADHIMSRMR